MKKFLKKIIKNKKVIKMYHNLILGIKNKYYSMLPEKKHLDILFGQAYGRPVNWDNPKTFNEKLQWLKVNNKNPEHTKLVDKYEVREYIKETIGEEYLIPLIGVWDRVEDIDFDSLPDKFVLKCTHGSGCNIICTDKNKLDIKNAKKKLNKWMKTNYYYFSREWPYKNVKPRIVAEKFMKDDNSSDLKDYKFLCFNGKVKCCLVTSERNSNELKLNFFDENWNDLPFENLYPRTDKKIAKPANYDQMIKLSEILSANNAFLRVDFYDINGKIYFGELTFFHGGGFLIFQPEEWDYKFGDLLNLK